MVRTQPLHGLPATYAPEELWIAGDTLITRSLVRLAESVDFRPSVFPTPAEAVSQTVFNPLAASSISAVVLIDSFEDQISILNHWISYPIAFLGVAATREQRLEIMARLHRLQPAAPREQLERIQCPIGLPIGAASVEEIAISIVARLIQNRSDRRISHEAASRIRSPSLIKARA